MFIKDKCYEMFDISNIMSDSSNLIWMKFDVRPLYWNMAIDFFFFFFDSV